MNKKSNATHMKIKYIKFMQLKFIPIIQDWFKLENYQILSFVLKIGGKSCDHLNKRCLTPFTKSISDKVQINMNGKTTKVLEYSI